MAIDLDKYLNYIIPQPKYIGKLKDVGMITADDIETAKKQSLAQGLLGAGLTYLAQPKNQGYGSAAPYVAKSLLGGLEYAEKPYQILKEDIILGQKFDALAREKKQQKALDEVLSQGGLYKETTTGGERTTPYKPVMKDGKAIAPDFTAPTYTPKKTTYDFDLGQIDKLISSGNISAANTLMDIEAKRRKTLADMRFGQLLTDDEAKALGLRIDKKQKYFRNKEGKPELIQGQMLTDSEMSAKRDRYKLITDESGTYYVPKDPASKLPVLQKTQDGYIDIGTYTKFKEYKPDLPKKEEIDAAYMSLKGFGVDNNTSMDAAPVVRDRAKDLMKKYQQGTGKEISFTQAVEIITKAANQSGAFDEKYINEFISKDFPINIDFDVDGKPVMFDGKDWRYIQ
jgi:hypothetical protein